METKKPETGILVPRNCFLWINNGLVKVDEMFTGDNLLCIDHEGKISQFPIDNNATIHGPMEIVNISTTDATTMLSTDSEVFLKSGEEKIINLSNNDSIQVVGPNIITQIKNVLEKNIDDRIGITEIEAELFSSLNFTIKEPHDTIFEIKDGKREEIIGKLKNISEKYDARIFEYGTTIRFSSSLFVTVSDMFLENRVPQILRRSTYSVMKVFFENFLLKSQKIPKENYELINFLQIMAMFERKQIKKKITENTVNITLSTDYTSSKNFSQIINFNRQMELVYRIPIHSNWNAIIDNFIVKKQRISYEIN